MQQNLYKPKRKKTGAERVAARVKRFHNWCRAHNYKSPTREDVERFWCGKEPEDVPIERTKIRGRTE